MDRTNAGLLTSKSFDQPHWPTNQLLLPSIGGSKPAHHSALVVLHPRGASGLCVQWDGTPPPLPSVENPVFGKIYLTHHTLVEYLDETKGECKLENVFPRLTRVVRDLHREVTLPSEVLRHKQHRHAGNQDGVRYLNSMAGWQLVTRPALDQSGLLAITVYQRQGY